METQKDSNSLDYSSCDNNYSSHSEVPTELEQNLHHAVHQMKDSPPNCKENLKKCKVLPYKEQVPLSRSRQSKRKQGVQEEPHQKRACLRNACNKQASGNNKEEDEDNDFVANTKAYTKSQYKKSTSDIQEINADDQQKSRKVFFDLETTSLFVDCDILQIGATDEKDDFSMYLIPTQSIDPRASAVTGLTFERGSLMYKGQPVEAHSRRIALQHFLEWIEKRTPVILFAHNATFDYTRFFHAITEEELVEDFRKHIVGFVNTLPVFKEKFPGLPKYNLSVLVENLLKKNFNAHNALGDVHALKELYCKANLDVTTKGSITFSSAYEKFEKQKRKRAKSGSKFRKWHR